MDTGRLTRSRIQRKVGRNVPGDSVGEHGGMRSDEEDGAVRLSDGDLWRETRLGAPTAGGVWDRVQGQRTREGSELGQDSEAGEWGGHKVIVRKGVGSREDEGDDDVAADVGSDAPEVGEAMGRNGVRKDAVDADEQEHDWTDPEWYVGQDVKYRK